MLSSLKSQKLVPESKIHEMLREVLLLLLSCQTLYFVFTSIQRCLLQNFKNPN